MKRKFDKNDVLRFLYGELNPSETDEFMDALCIDEELFETFEALKDVQDDLDDAVLEPSAASVNAVMDFVANSHDEEVIVSQPVKDSHNFGFPKKRGLFGIPQLASAAMIILSVFTVGFAVKAYQHNPDTQDTIVSSAEWEWDTQSLDEQLNHARMRLNNIQGDRETIFPVHHNTYRLVNSSLFSPIGKELVLLNIK